jgi:glutathione synthase/RimK-type ligase-like ATP-grasp enzyme
MKPDLSHLLPGDQSLESILKTAQDFGYPLVCKDNRGAGGNLVFKVKNESELKTTLDQIWSTSRGVALSPLYDIENEYRFFILDTKIKFGYKKIKAQGEWKFNLNRGGEQN